MRKYTLEELYNMSPQEFFDTTMAESVDAQIEELNDENGGDVWEYQYHRLGQGIPRQHNGCLMKMLRCSKSIASKREGGSCRE
jgi:hypothetical protein